MTVVDLWEKGLTTKEIAEQLHIAQRTVQRKLNNAGIQLQKTQQKKRYTKKYSENLKNVIERMNRFDLNINIKKCGLSDEERHLLYKTTEWKQFREKKKMFKEVLIALKERLGHAMNKVNQEHYLLYSKIDNEKTNITMLDPMEKRYITENKKMRLYNDLEYVKSMHNIDLYNSILDEELQQKFEEVINDFVKNFQCLNEIKRAVIKEITKEKQREELPILFHGSLIRNTNDKRYKDINLYLNTQKIS